ncbi:MAG TPA: hypothetical protein VGS19_36750 [Streptosporangiaceae bacterium]|nr:hypothetical protein [Streptosporangiaceae bacterium]
MNGDTIRDTRFRLWSGGYEVNEVRDLLNRVAAEIDAGRAAGPLIQSATFRRNWALSRGWGYDVDGVDWFLGQLLACPGDYELSGQSEDPWRGHGVSSERVDDGFSSRGSADRALAFLHRFLLGGPFPAQCRDAWRDLPQLPGTRLWWGRTGVGRYELRTARQQTLACLPRPRTQGRGRASHLPFGVWDDGPPMSVSAAGKSYTLKSADHEDERPPLVAEIATRSLRDCLGHFARNGPALPTLRGMGFPAVRELADDTGLAVLYTSGDNFFGRAYARISFQGGRWLRFLVRGTRLSNAIMTAIDQDGQRVARYRAVGGIHKRRRQSVEITVKPNWTLSAERILAITMSAPWLSSYFDQPDPDKRTWDPAHIS